MMSKGTPDDAECVTEILGDKNKEVRGYKVYLHLLRIFKLQYCTKFGQLILRKIIKIVATRSHILRVKCTKIDIACRISGVFEDVAS